jgi:Dinucleotide-utilizing enzymes involved in molybdopterin and thiamine biosynthesis family 2
MPKAPDQENNDCQSQGIIGTIAGVIGTLMANETIKEILSFKDTISGKILIIDLQKTIFRLVNLNKNCQNHR